jgi:hypothetical protein
VWDDNLKKRKRGEQNGKRRREEVKKERRSEVERGGNRSNRTNNTMSGFNK